MAHNIEFNEQRQSYSIISTEPTWHHLENAKYYDKPLTTIEALQGCNADFEVEKQPIVALTPELVSMIENGQFVNASQITVGNLFHVFFNELQVLADARLAGNLAAENEINSLRNNQNNC